MSKSILEFLVCFHCLVVLLVPGIGSSTNSNTLTFTFSGPTINHYGNIGMTAVTGGSLSFGIYIYNTSSVRIQEHGSTRATFGRAYVGDNFSIKKINGVTKYYHEGRELYSSVSSQDAVTPLYFGVAIYRSSMFTNIRIEY